MVTLIILSPTWRLASLLVVVVVSSSFWFPFSSQHYYQVDALQQFQIYRSTAASRRRSTTTTRLLNHVPLTRNKGVQGFGGEVSISPPIRPSSPLFHRQKNKRYVSTTHLFSSAVATNSDDKKKDQSKDTKEKDDDDDDGGMSKPFSKRIVTSRLLLLAGIFYGGYQIGLQMAMNSLRTGKKAMFSMSQSSSTTLTNKILSGIIVFLLLRGFWDNIPGWLKPKLLQRAISDTKILFGFKKKSDSASKTSGSGDDITDFDTLFGKLGAMQKIFQTKLPKSTKKELNNEVERGENQAVPPPFNLQGSFLSLLNLVRQIKQEKIPARDEFYASCGQQATMDDFNGLQQYMEYADWAYDEDPSGKSLKELLEEQNWCLLKHDTTTVPGYLGHYVAIPTNETSTTTVDGNKVALIGVKGTSEVEDLITDMCGTPVTMNLDYPYYQYGNNTSTSTLRVHEGIMIGTRRLATDLIPFVKNLLLPQGYKIVIVGHSLGAASAALLAMILRSKIPEFQKYDTSNGASNRLLQVYAFASPPTVDLQNALDTAPFITTTVNNCDIITRCNVGTLLATAELLKDVNNKLAERKEREKKKKRRWRFWRKPMSVVTSDKSEDNDLLKQADELTKFIENATEKVANDADEDHLYVPGKVILMYDEWGKNTTEIVVEKDLTSADKNQTDEDSAIPETAADNAIVCNGTAKALQYIEFDGQMVDDHMTKCYKDSLKSVVDQLKEKNSTNSKST